VTNAKQSKASVAFGGSVPVGAQMHSGEQVCPPIAAPKMNRQSDATGIAPLLTGCAHSWAVAEIGNTATAAHTNAARKNDFKLRDAGFIESPP
jgi:hypothetical protein